MEPNGSNVSAKVISALIIGLIVGFVAGAFWQERRLSTPASDDVAAVEETKSAEKGTTTPKTSEVAKEKDTKTDVKSQAAAVVKSVVSSDGAAEVTAADQSAGSKVSVSVTNVSEPIWIAVREEKDGALGNILGAGKVFADGDATITLLRSTTAGGTYRVVMYKDVGDTGFNHKEDVLVEEGQITFKAK